MIKTIFDSFFSKEKITREISISDELMSNFKKNYPNIKNIKEIVLFKRESILFVEKKVIEIGYGDQKEFIKEIKYLLYYLFLVLQDDYFCGDKVFKNNMTQFDNYIFSSYRQNEKLSCNIKKLITLASSNRFNPNTKENILSYFVFLEESGIEIIEILEDFYLLLSGEIRQEKEEKEILNSFEDNSDTVSVKSLLSLSPTLNETSTLAKFKISREDIDKELRNEK